MAVTRFAPAPTGMFHIGSCRTAYLNFLEARATNGMFILRVDNTDIERNKQEYIDVILDSMKWLGLEYDEIHYQSERTKIYLERANQLLDGKYAKRLENGAIALDISFWAKSSFNDSISGEITITETNREQIKDLILVRGGDKIDQPTYQFCSVVDDYEMGITHIIRGIDHLSNCPKQIAIWQALQEIDGTITERPIPKLTHTGMVLKDKKKLSKRDGAASLLTYRDEGYKPEAILNFVLMLGWSVRVPRGDKELERVANGPISKELAIELWDKGAMKNSPCNFDIAKLNSIQKFYNNN